MKSEIETRIDRILKQQLIALHKEIACLQAKLSEKENDLHLVKTALKAVRDASKKVNEIDS